MADIVRKLSLFFIKFFDNEHTYLVFVIPFLILVFLMCIIMMRQFSTKKKFRKNVLIEINTISWSNLYSETCYSVLLNETNIFHFSLGLIKLENENKVQKRNVVLFYGSYYQSNIFRNSPDKIFPVLPVYLFLQHVKLIYFYKNLKFTLRLFTINYLSHILYEICKNYLKINP